MPDENDKSTTDEKPAETQAAEQPAGPPVETHHQLSLGDRTLHYTVNTGMMPMKNSETGETEGNIFFVAYTLDNVDDPADRPLVFAFNGGPGAGSVWLHLGALGPRRVKMQDEGWMPAPPYRLVPNEHTWLDIADIVFIDPIGTGYSRATKTEHNQKFWSLQGDLDSVGEFIRLYLTHYQRWASPLFVAGESYGTTRAAGLAGHLVDKGIGLAGIVMISSILNFQTARFVRGNDLPYALFLPTYTATAWYHQQLPEDLQSKPLAEVLEEVEAWAETEYHLALMRGDRLTGEERDEVVNRLARYTGLDSTYIELTNLRIQIHRFCKELLRKEQRTVGRLDSRFKGRDALGVSEFPDFDPANIAITPPYTMMMNHYARSELGFETDTEYNSLSFDVNEKWEFPRGQFPDTSEALRSAFAKNPFMKLFVGQGYFDLATVHSAARYTLDHMDISPDLRDNIELHYYEAGHMFYLDIKSLAKFKQDVSDFIARTLSQ